MFLYVISKRGSEITTGKTSARVPFGLKGRALNEPPSLGSRGLCLERWLDLDLLRSAGVARPSAAAAVEPAASSSRVVGGGDGLFVRPARPLLVGLPVIVLYSQSWAILLIFKYHFLTITSGSPIYVVISHNFCPNTKVLSLLSETKTECKQSFQATIFILKFVRE